MGYSGYQWHKRQRYFTRREKQKHRRDHHRSAKIPIAITSPGSVSRALGGGASGMRIFFVLIKGSVMVGGRAA
jgi:hypothetical protein